MNFTQAVKSVLAENYANFKGRASRAEFWWYFVFGILIQIIFYALFAVFGGYEWITSIWIATAQGSFDIPPAPGMIKFIAIAYGIFSLAVLVPSLAVLTRRFHDRGMSGWWVFGLIALGILSSFLPFINFLVVIAIYIIAALPGNDGGNKYGAKPIA